MNFKTMKEETCSFSESLLKRLQNKSKRPENYSLAGTDGGKESALAPDTGQSPADEHAEEPQTAAAGSTCSPASNTNNYNLVTSLLNLTKSPVRPSHSGGLFPLCVSHESFC